MSDQRRAGPTRTALVVTSVVVLAVLIAVLRPWRQAETQAWKTLPAPAPLPTPDESGLAPVGDIHMWYAIFNKGGDNPVLLIHGGLGSAENWGNQIQVLTRTHKVIVADTRGHGRSTRSEGPFGYDVLTDDYVALLDRLKIDKVALVGWSDGAIIGLDMAMRYPERLTRLWAFGANFNLAGLRPDPDKESAVGLASAVARKEYERLSSTPDEYDTFCKAIEQMWSTQPDYKPGQLARITTPTIIADGEHDELITREHPEKLARLIPGAKLLIMPGVSHFAPLQNPALYNRELKRFLDSP